MLNNRFVITAAHCVADTSPNEVIISVGSSWRNTTGTSYEVAQIKVHPSFNPLTLANDIALLMTTSNISFNSNVASIALPTAATGANTEAIVSGWGFLGTAQDPTNQLQVLKTTTTSNLLCSLLTSLLNSDQICTYDSIFQGICNGDAGSPLTVNRKLVGIGSWNSICGIGLANFFTRVYSHLSWINGIMS